MDKPDFLDSAWRVVFECAALMVCAAIVAVISVWAVNAVGKAFASHAPQPIIPQRGQVEMWDGTRWRPVTLKLICTPASRWSATLNCVAVLP